MSLSRTSVQVTMSIVMQTASRVLLPLFIFKIYLYMVNGLNKNRRLNIKKLIGCWEQNCELRFKIECFLLGLSKLIFANSFKRVSGIVILYNQTELYVINLVSTY